MYIYVPYFYFYFIWKCKSLRAWFMDNAWPIGRCLIYKFPHWIRIRFCFKHCLQNKSHQNLMLTTFALMSRLATSHLFWTETSLLKLLLGVQAYIVATSDPAYMQSKFFHFANQSIMFYCCLDCVRLQWLIFKRIFSFWSLKIWLRLNAKMTLKPGLFYFISVLVYK